MQPVVPEDYNGAENFRSPSDVVVITASQRKALLMFVATPTMLLVVWKYGTHSSVQNLTPDDNK